MAKAIESELVDTDVVYATANDVFTHIRNKRYSDLPDTASDVGANEPGILTKEQIVDLIARFSERADKTTKRAWRRRRVSDYEVRIQFDHETKRGRHRRRSRRAGHGTIPRVRTHAGRRGFGDLPHNHVVDVESAVVLNPRLTNDISADEGREDGSYIVDERKGIIRPDVSLFVPTGTGSMGGLDIEDARVRVTYTFGVDPQPSSEPDLLAPYQLSTAVPGDITDAVALMTAARLIGSDQYGELVPNQSGDTPSLSEAASDWRQEAKETLRDYERP